MLLKALKTDDPDAKLAIYDEILKIEPNADARAGYKEAKAAADQKHAAAAAEAQKQNDKRVAEIRGKAALKAAEQALIARDFMGARAKLNEAKSLGQTGPDFLRIERLVSAAESKATMWRYSALGAAGVVLLGAALWMVSLFRKGQPYVETLTGAAGRRRYPIEKDVLTIGALAQKGEEKNDIVVTDPEKTVSRFHCEIHRKGRNFYLVDCRSANGTRLDGRLIPAGRLVPVKRGARIQLGASCTLKFGFERRKR
jgi:hypothetical protein